METNKIPEQDPMQALRNLLDNVAPEKFVPLEVIGYRCTADGKHFAQFKEKRCRYCQPIYREKGVAE